MTMYIASFSNLDGTHRTRLDVAFANVSNRADWTQSATVLDYDTREVVDISAADITVTVKDQYTDTVLLETTIDDGTAEGVFEWSFDDSLMRALDPGTYNVGGIIEIGAATDQLFAGTVSVIGGNTR